MECQCSEHWPKLSPWPCHLCQTYITFRHLKYRVKNRKTELVYSPAYILNITSLSVNSFVVYIFMGILIFEAIHSRLLLFHFTKQCIDTGTELLLLQADHCGSHPGSSRELSCNIRLQQRFINVTPWSSSLNRKLSSRFIWNYIPLPWPNFFQPG